MPRRTKEPKTPSAARLPPHLLAEIDALARDLSFPGHDWTRTEMMTIALTIGAEQLRKQGLPSRYRPAPKAPSARPKAKPRQR